MIKILITGDRHWTDYKMIQSVLQEFAEYEPTIIHGVCRGADMLADKAARELGYPIRKFHANWDLYGRAAGPMRNTRMLKENPDIVLAFHPDLAKSKGTKNMVKQAHKANIPIVWYSETGEMDLEVERLK